MKKTHILFWMVVLAVTLPADVAPNAAETADPVGSVVALRGKAVAVDPGGALRQLALKDPVFIEEKDQLPIQF